MSKVAFFMGTALIFSGLVMMPYMLFEWYSYGMDGLGIMPPLGMGLTFGGLAILRMAK